MLWGPRYNISNLAEKAFISVGKKHLRQVKLTESRVVYIDQILFWDFHIENMMKKISSGIGAISRLNPFVCRDYCYEVWHLIGNILSKTAEFTK